jgi:hypothetical protein
MIILFGHFLNGRVLLIAHTRSLDNRVCLLMSRTRSFAAVVLSFNPVIPSQSHSNPPSIKAVLTLKPQYVKMLKIFSADLTNIGLVRQGRNLDVANLGFLVVLIMISNF